MNQKQKSEHLYLDIFSEKNSKIILWSFVIIYVFLFMIYPHKENDDIFSEIIKFFSKKSGTIALWSVIGMYIIAIRPYGGGLFKTLWFYIKNILDFTSKIKTSISDNKKENLKQREKLIEALPIIILNLGLISYFFCSIWAIFAGANRFTITFESSFAIATFVLCTLYTLEMLTRHNHYPFEAYKLNKQLKKEAKRAKKEAKLLRKAEKKASKEI